MAAALATIAALTGDPTAELDSETPLVPIRRRPLHDEATERIRDMIVEGRLAAGEWINEAELCQQLQISRTPLREALKVLATEGQCPTVGRHGGDIALVHAAARREVAVEGPQAVLARRDGVEGEFALGVRGHAARGRRARVGAAAE